VVISAALVSRTLRASSIDFDSSHFNSCVVGLVRRGAAFQAKTPYPSDPSAATPRGSDSHEKRRSPFPPQKAIEQLDIRQIIERLVVELFRHLDTTETTSRAKKAFPFKTSERHAMYRQPADR
jgi:hypothetical protein